MVPKTASLGLPTTVTYSWLSISNPHGIGSGCTDTARYLRGQELYHQMIHEVPGPIHVHFRLTAAAFGGKQSSSA